jgi:hypothetical protein
MCIHGQNGFADSLKQTECTLFHRIARFLHGLMIVLESLLAFHPDLQLETPAPLAVWAEEGSQKREGGGQWE